MTHPRVEQLKDKHLFRTQAFVNGAWVDAGDKATFDVIDPATAEKIATAPDMDVADTQKAIDAAHDAFGSWRKTSIKQRYDILSRWSRLILENKEDLATIMTLENGKPYTEAIGEVAYAQSFIEWFAEETKRVYGDVIPTTDTNQRSLVIRQPVGVCSVLTPWNFPSAMLTRKAGAALAAGCTVVAKPAAETPYSALALAELAHRAGVPAGALNVVTTDKRISEVGKELCTNDSVRKVSFTGSTAVGKYLMELCASGMKRVSLELGGNAPVLVFEDADLEAAAAALLTSKLRNSGQVCVAPNRIYVQSTIKDQFAQVLVKHLEKMNIGGGFNQGVHMGPVITERARNKVLAHIEDAAKRGGRVLLDGRKRRVETEENARGFFIHPTLISDLTPDAIVNSEETFGPLLAMRSFDTEEEAITLANQSDVGLAAYVYTNATSRIFRVSEAIEAGMVSVNGGDISETYLPFGGVKESGVGREGSKYGIDEYLEKKLIAVALDTKTGA